MASIIKALKQIAATAQNAVEDSVVREVVTDPARREQLRRERDEKQEQWINGETGKERK